ncbi:hypothetical protein Nm8I071_36770 [Nonomuraea sp. TT08I-71]|nr:hypothetical protein Nm8I071_36770 [Nonomuraea sp. TT08I-71]
MTNAEGANSGRSFELSPAESMRIFEELIVPSQLNSERQRDPKILVVAGQPGSGKSSVQSELKRRFHLAGAAEIDADDLRAFHPKWLDLSMRDDRSAADLTHPDATRWTAMSLEYAASQSYEVVLSATLGKVATTRKVLDSFRRGGYRIIVVIVAVNEVVSRLGILSRYMRQRATQGFGRFVPRKVHDLAYVGILETADAIDLNLLADEVIVSARAQVADFVYHNRLGAESRRWHRPPGTREAITWERQKSWTAEEYLWYQQTIVELSEVLPTDLLEEFNAIREAASGLVTEHERRTAVQMRQDPGATATSTIAVPRQRFPFHDSFLDEG